MENRKSAIIDALLLKAETLADAHLAISTQDIPKSFRYGLNVDVTEKPMKTAAATVAAALGNEGELTKKSSMSDFQVIESLKKKDADEFSA
ncbi:unnamed protein product, partial [Gongylonema pulchrum]|uniref:DHHA1 domain-containing protein n=1 Tax=Gongylonema pulchrum TaxID=637853 RepID=A0A183EU89_9BILA